MFSYATTAAFVISCYAHCDHGNTFNVDKSGSSSNCSQSLMFKSESSNCMLSVLSGTKIQVLPPYSQSTTTFSPVSNAFSENIFSQHNYWMEKDQLSKQYHLFYYS